MSNNVKLSYCGVSDMGRQRTNNEDAFVVEQLEENVVLAVVIDGVGGYEGGEVASEIAKNEIHDYLKQFNRGERIELLKQAVASANNAIFERRKTDLERPNMSCVLTSSIIDVENKVINMVHVGDTRLYQYHHGELKKLSHDHSLVGYREEIGDLTEEEAMHHPQRNVIGRDVGSAYHEIADPDFIEAEQFPLLPNTIFLLCSDGLTDLVTSKQITTILEKNTALKTKAQELVAAANEAGGKDNITVVLVEYKANESKTPQKTTETTERIIPNAPQPIVETIQHEMPRQKPKRKSGLLWITITLLAVAIALVGYYIWENYDFSISPKSPQNDMQEVIIINNDTVSQGSDSTQQNIRP